MRHLICRDSTFLPNEDELLLILNKKEMLIYSILVLFCCEEGINTNRLLFCCCCWETPGWHQWSVETHQGQGWPHLWISSQLGQLTWSGQGIHRCIYVDWTWVHRIWNLFRMWKIKFEICNRKHRSLGPLRSPTSSPDGRTATRMGWLWALRTCLTSSFTPFGAEACDPRNSDKIACKSL